MALGQSAGRSGCEVLQSDVAQVRASRKASTTGRISIIRKLGDKNNLRGFDLSERLIVPIVSPVKVDPRLPDRPLVWKRI